MATMSMIGDEPISNHDLEEIKQLLWGNDIKYDVFRRWTQGILFSEDEPTALSQLEGGPCAVLAPLQAFLVKNAMFSMNCGNNWRDINGEQRKMLLCMALAEMLSLVSSSDATYLVQYRPYSMPSEVLPQADLSSNDAGPHLDTAVSPTPASDVSDPASQNAHPSGTTQPLSYQNQSASSSGETNGRPDPRSTVDGSQPADTPSHNHSADDASNGSSPKKKCLSHEEFHLSLRCRRCHSREEVMNQLKLHVSELHNQYGVLLLLYSTILTKGIEQVKNEIGDLSEPLIDGTYGHGSQSLINLLITGKAVSNVWDNEKDLSGLKLCGITKQSTIGFLTQLEHLRYCEVGWFLKNPQVPVWLLGSETHLTVLFSQEKGLVILESPEAEARRVFCNFDPEGRGFIMCEHLQNLMAALNLVSETEYVKIMQIKLDPDQLGIVTLNSFMEEFFPEERDQQVVNRFAVMHYNGLSRSCNAGKLRYAMGEATIQDMPEVQIITDTSTIKTCMMTKWPTIELKWDGNHIPSLN